MAFVADEVVTAAKLNLATAIGWDQNTDSRTFTNATPLDLDALTGGAGTMGPIRVTITTGAVAVIFTQAFLANSTLGASVTLNYRVTGASTISSVSVLAHESGAANDFEELCAFRIESGLTPGSNVFEMTAQVSGGTGDIRRPRLMVMPILG